MELRKVRYGLAYGKLWQGFDDVCMRRATVNRYAVHCIERVKVMDFIRQHREKHEHVRAGFIRCKNGVLVALVIGSGAVLLEYMRGVLRNAA